MDNNQTIVYEVTIKEIKITPSVDGDKYDREQTREIYQQRFNTIDVKSVVSSLNKSESK